MGHQGGPQARSCGRHRTDGCRMGGMRALVRPLRHANTCIHVWGHTELHVGKRTRLVAKVP